VVSFKTVLVIVGVVRKDVFVLKEEDVGRRKDIGVRVNDRVRLNALMKMHVPVCLPPLLLIPPLPSIHNPVSSAIPDEAVQAVLTTIIC